MIAMNLGDTYVSDIFKKESPSDEEVKKAVQSVMDSGAVEMAKNHAQDFYDRAISAISNIKPSIYKESLISLADTIMTRRS